MLNHIKTELHTRFAFCAAYVRKKRFDKIISLSGIEPHLTLNENKLKIFEAGCASGKDFINFLSGNDNVEIIGMDLKDHHIEQSNFTFSKGDIEAINFPDNYFDLSISVGVLEHIQPVEKLSNAIRELTRVSKAYVMVVPSVATLIEPHTACLFWQIKDRNHKKPYGRLNYYSDDAWCQFEGFRQAKTHRSHLIFPIVSNLYIYNPLEY